LRDMVRKHRRKWRTQARERSADFVGGAFARAVPDKSRASSTRSSWRRSRREGKFDETVIALGPVRYVDRPGRARMGTNAPSQICFWPRHRADRDTTSAFLPDARRAQGRLGRADIEQSLARSTSCRPTREEAVQFYRLREKATRSQ